MNAPIRAFLLLILCLSLVSACEDESGHSSDSDTGADAVDASDIADGVDGADEEDVSDVDEDGGDAVDARDVADTRDVADVVDTSDSTDTEEDVEVDSGAFCGDGILQPDAGEACDDGNLEPGDGCDEHCRELTGATRWALGFGGDSFDLGYGVATDSNGNVYVVGMFRGTTVFGADTFTATGGDVFLAKIDPSGSLIWTRHFGGNGDNVPFHVEVDSNDDVYVSGYFKGSLELNSNTTLYTAGGADAFIAKLDSDGTLLWNKHFGDRHPDGVYGLALDDSDNLYAVGDFKGTVDFGDGPVTSTDAAEGAAGDDDIFVLKYEPSGQLASSVTLGNGADVSGSDIGVDGAGNIYVTGTLSSDVDFGGGSLVNAGWLDIFLLKLDVSGQHVWSQRFGGPEYDRARSITVDSDVTLVGSVSGDVDFGGGALSSNGGRDIFVAQFDNSGAHRWSTALGGAGTDQRADIEATPDGDLLVTGVVFGDADLGGGVVAGGDEANIFVTRLDATGVFIWAQRAAGSGASPVHELAVAEDGRIYSTGYFDESVDFGGVSLTSNGSQDIFLWAMDP